MISECISAGFSGMSDKVLADRIKAVNLFARRVPEQKLRLVQALKANGEVVETQRLKAPKARSIRKF